eukprot:gene5848-7044_t
MHGVGLGGDGLLGQDPYGAIAMQKVNQPHSEFSIQNEDFPALPGAMKGGEGTRGDGSDPQESALAQQAYQMSRASSFPQGQGGTTGVFGGLAAVQQHIATSAASTSAGLDANAQLHSALGGDPNEFGEPFAGYPQAGYFTKFQEETLFYIFYSMPGDEAQLYAADELSNRGWAFHKELKVWLAVVPGTEPLVKNNQYERGSFFIFDTNTWERIRKDNFVLHYDKLEQRVQPPIPTPGEQAQQAQ